MNDVTDVLVRLRRRMAGQFFADRLAFCALLFSAGLLTIAAANVLRGATPLNAPLCGVALVGTVISAGIWTWSRLPSLERTASLVDLRAGTRDRFLTAYDFSRAGTRTTLQDAAMRECARFIGEFDVTGCTRFRSPRLLRWLIVPVVALGLLAWHGNLAHRPAESGENQTAGQSATLEKIAQTIEKTNSDDLKKIADEIRKSEMRMKAAKPEEAEKTALKEMSSLENKMEEMLKSGKKSTPDELAAVVAGLKQSELTKEAASDLQQGKAEEAAKKLDQLSQQQKQDAQLGKAAEAVRQALARLSEEQKGAISREMERQAQANQQGKESAGAQALQRLAGMLRQAGGAQQQQGGKQAGQQNSGDKQSQESLRNALAALQNLKYGGNQQQGKEGNPGGQQGKQGAQVMMQSFGQPGAKDGQALVQTGAPSGMPGTEHDLGTTKDPFGAPQKKSDEKTAKGQVSGVAGEGESLHDFMTSTGDNSKATRLYRELYDSLLPAAENAVEQENIPLGSRFYIKRYFQSIRPKE